MLLLEDKRNEIAKERDQLIEDGFIKVFPEKLVFEVDLVSLCYRYGPVKGEYFSKLLNKLLYMLDHKYNYEIRQSIAFLSVITTATKRKENTDGSSSRHPFRADVRFDDCC